MSRTKKKTTAAMRAADSAERERRMLADYRLLTYDRKSLVAEIVATCLDVQVREAQAILQDGAR